MIFGTIFGNMNAFFQSELFRLAFSSSWVFSAVVHTADRATVVSCTLDGLYVLSAALILLPPCLSLSEHVIIFCFRDMRVFRSKRKVSISSPSPSSGMIVR